MIAREIRRRKKAKCVAAWDCWPNVVAFLQFAERGG